MARKAGAKAGPPVNPGPPQNPGPPGKPQGDHPDKYFTGSMEDGTPYWQCDGCGVRWASQDLVNLHIENQCLADQYEPSTRLPNYAAFGPNYKPDLSQVPGLQGKEKKHG